MESFEQLHEDKRFHFVSIARFHPKKDQHVLLEEYTDGCQVNQIVPDDFARWVFPKLFKSRLPKYEMLAQRYGVALESEKLRDVLSEEEFQKTLQSKQMTKIEIYTDGACSGNPGPGGWGALLRSGGHEKEMSGGEDDTTNNRMEMMAVIKALEALKKPSHVDLYTDSKYVMQGVNEWLAGWKAKRWKTASKKPVKNQDLWQRIDSLIQTHNVVFHWVKGHAGHPENEKADQLATSAIPRG